MAEDESGRYRQRRRTRDAIVAAATRLLADGATPTIADVADAADVSRRTVYLHFPTLEQLLIDATLGALSQHAVDAAIDAAAAEARGDVDSRVSAMVDAVAGQSRETLPLGRTLIRLTVEGQSEPGRPRRGYRRVAWIEKAVAPLRERLTDGQYERLVSGLAMVVGWEALIVLQDLRGLAPDEQHDTTLWAARALIAAALDPS